VGEKFTILILIYRCYYIGKLPLKDGSC